MENKFSILDLDLRQKIYVFLAIWCIGAFAMGIHLLMLNSGVPHPREGGYISEKGILLSLAGIMKYVLSSIEIIVMLWLSVKIRAYFKHMSKFKLFLLLFVLFCAAQELLIRLPLSAGYVIDQKFVFYWLYAIVPDIVEIFIICIPILAYIALRKSKYAERAQTFIVARTRLRKNTCSLIVEGAFIFLALLLCMVVKFYLRNYLLMWHDSLINYVINHKYLIPPNSENILQHPYPWQVIAIAMSTFVEASLAVAFIGFILYKFGYQSYLKLSLMILLVILALSDHMLGLSYHILLSKFELSMAILSMSQFTLEYIFMAMVLPFVIFYIRDKSGYNKRQNIS